MTSLRSSTLMFAAFAPAPVSSEAVSRPLITRVRHADLEKGDELLLRVDLLASRAAGLHPPCRAQHAIAVERQQAGEQAGPGCFWCRLEREHLYMAFADCYVVAVPCDRTFHDLPVYAGVAAELVALGPLFEVEEVAEKLKGLGLIEQTQSQASCRDGTEEWLRSFQDRTASARCRWRSPAACARTLSPSMAPA